jgi:hypothetical protein
MPHHPAPPKQQLLVRRERLLAPMVVVERTSQALLAIPRELTVAAAHLTDIVVLLTDTASSRMVARMAARTQSRALQLQRVLATPGPPLRRPLESPFLVYPRRQPTRSPQGRPLLTEAAALHLVTLSVVTGPKVHAARCMVTAETPLLTVVKVASLVLAQTVPLSLLQMPSLHQLLPHRER